MENNKVSYLKSEDGKIINETCIKWVHNCLEVCTKSSGCSLFYDTHKICNDLESYNKLNKHLSKIICQSIFLLKY